MDLTVVVPTYDEAPNVRELVRRIVRAVRGIDAEILFVDDSSDDTPDVVRAVAAESAVPVRLIHREAAVGGLGGAVVEGVRAAQSDLCVVMDGDLQHPPEKIPELLARREQTGADVVIASRYAGGGTSHGLATRLRHLVSTLATLVTKSMFPVRLHGVSDPMTGYFLLDRRAVDFAGLQPRGFKILLEILARQHLSVAEIPFDFADRYAGASKASVRQGARFLTQLGFLRFGKMSLFALIGALGAVANVLIVWALTSMGVNYIVAAVIAAELTIVGNFLLIERFVFREMREQASGVWVRFGKSFAFNNAEALVRIPVIALLVETGHVSSVLATAVTLVVAFFVRFVFHALVVYAPRRPGPKSLAREVAEELDEQAMQPGEL